jgi:Zn-dependent peptidase ImmA (M78 family)/DNA-binding XRE family transcriptional regulator
MNAHVPNPAGLPFNGAMFRWARERRELSVAEAAKRVGVKPEAVEAWEVGAGFPTVRQARFLADLYDRSFLEFFRSEPPVIAGSSHVPDFRLHRGEPRPHESRDLKDLQAWAESTRLNALDLYDILGEAPPQLPEAMRAAMTETPDLVAARVREAIGFPIEEQMNRKAADRDVLPRRLRSALEAVGVLVLKSGELRDFGARGLCIAARPLPVIVFGGEAQNAQMFTLTHELGHICIGQSAVSGPPGGAHHGGEGQDIEAWCNRFAAAFLVPQPALDQVRRRPDRPLPEIDDEPLNTLAKLFGVSPHAMTLRLIELGYVEPEHYWRDRRARFLAQESAYKGGGRAKYYGSRYRSAVGDLYTGLVLEAWATNRITNHNAAEFMGIKNPRHLKDIRDNFAAS